MPSNHTEPELIWWTSMPYGERNFRLIIPEGDFVDLLMNLSQEERAVLDVLDSEGPLSSKITALALVVRWIESGGK